MEIGDITLVRGTEIAGTVYGILTIKHSTDGHIKTQRINTIENKEYIFPKGEYKIVRENSPKFKRQLWEFKGIKGRSEIKFHFGTRKEHSKGCILVSRMGESIIELILDSKNKYKITVK